ncbi:unnamed protein product [Effrenium voratum]|uniref:Uncharacterized protein n=1 Tax=Effrenium voratum TaxID=2562239 RepID=A0AA36JKK5_9DINO|nr:unnamed protein product [Effrenium voratum]
MQVTAEHVGRQSAPIPSPDRWSNEEPCRGRCALGVLLILPYAYQAFLAPSARSALSSRSSRLARRAEASGPVGDWVECEISYTPTISVHHSVVEPRRSDVYIFHKRQLQEDFGHLYAKLGFTVSGLMYKDVKTHCREPEGLVGQCSDCFKFFFGGAIGFTGTTSPKYYDRQQVGVQECVGDTMRLYEEANAIPDRSRPDMSIWCMKEGVHA